MEKQEKEPDTEEQVQTEEGDERCQRFIPDEFNPIKQVGMVENGDISKAKSPDGRIPTIGDDETHEDSDLGYIEWLCLIHGY